MKNIYAEKFSKIGTNPSKYFENYELYINKLLKGSELVKKGTKLLDSSTDSVIFEANSETTIKQNIDAWIWMGFLIEKFDGNYIKIINKKNHNDLEDIIKINLLIDDDDLINKHRSTIIIKLLFLNNEKNLDFSNLNVQHNEIKKECGKFEKEISKDKKFLDILKLVWGVSNE